MLGRVLRCFTILTLTLAFGAQALAHHGHEARAHDDLTCLLCQLSGSPAGEPAAPCEISPTFVPQSRDSLLSRDLLPLSPPDPALHPRRGPPAS